MGSHVPDFRGLFLRGHGGASGALGIKQEQSYGKHTHELGFLAHGNGYNNGGFGAFYPFDFDTSKVVSELYDEKKRFSGPEIFEKDEELYPNNIAVRYLVRARP